MILWGKKEEREAFTDYLINLELLSTLQVKIKFNHTIFIFKNIILKKEGF